jgi:hypothetical protein
MITNSLAFSHSPDKYCLGPSSSFTAHLISGKGVGSAQSSIFSHLGSDNNDREGGGEGEREVI